MVRMKPPHVPEEPVPVLGDDELRRMLAACEGKGFEERRDMAIVRLFLDSDGGGLGVLGEEPPHGRADPVHDVTPSGEEHRDGQPRRTGRLDCHLQDVALRHAGERCGFDPLKALARRTAAPPGEIAVVSSITTTVWLFVTPRSILPGLASEVDALLARPAG